VKLFLTKKPGGGYCEKKAGLELSSIYVIVRKTLIKISLRGESPLLGGRKLTAPNVLEGC